MSARKTSSWPSGYRRGSASWRDPRSGLPSKRLAHCRGASPCSPSKSDLAKTLKLGPNRLTTASRSDPLPAKPRPTRFGNRAKLRRGRLTDVLAAYDLRSFELELTKHDAADL